MVQRGELIAAGRTSDVFSYGRGYVVKVLRPGVPDEWAELEAHHTAAVGQLGLPVPCVDGVIDVDGRPGIVFEHIVGPSLWTQICDEPMRVGEFIRLLAEVQQQVHSAGIPKGVPDLVVRLGQKIHGVGHLNDAERAEGCALASGLPRGAALLHGDLHPGNILMSAAGAVIIDWFDAAIGHPVADVVRSSILLRPGVSDVGLPHLPGANRALLAEMHEAYIESFASTLARADTALARWEAVIAASRLVEGAQSDESTLIDLWRSRSASTASTMLRGSGVVDESA